MTRKSFAVCITRCEQCRTRIQTLSVKTFVQEVVEGYQHHNNRLSSRLQTPAKPSYPQGIRAYHQ